LNLSIPHTVETREGKGQCLDLASGRVLIGLREKLLHPAIDSRLVPVAGVPGTSAQGIPRFVAQAEISERKSPTACIHCIHCSRGSAGNRLELRERSALSRESLHNGLDLGSCQVRSISSPRNDGCLCLGALRAPALQALRQLLLLEVILPPSLLPRLHSPLHLKKGLSGFLVPAQRQLIHELILLLAPELHEVRGLEAVPLGHLLD
jgi:hypothetical protein